MKELRENFTAALTNIYSLNIVPFFARFLEGEQAVLLAILEFKKTMPSEICKATGIERNRMSAIIKSLRAKEYILVARDTCDKRKMNLSLTTKGKNFILEKIIQANNVFDRLIKAIGDKNIMELTRIINLAVEEMKDGIYEFC